MKRFTIALLTTIFAMSMPMIAAAAMDHGSHDKTMAEDMKHDAKEMSHDMGNQKDDFVEIGKDTQKGVVATAKVKTYDEKTLASMAKMD